MWLGGVVVALGWMQSLIVCKRPCCGGHVKLTPRCVREGEFTAANRGAAPACPCCCARTEQHPADGSERIQARCCDGCEHVALGVELDLPPHGAGLDDVPPQAFAAMVLPVAMLGADTAPVPHPPATGPPRTDARVALRATTLLLL